MNKTVKILCGLVATAISATTLAETYNKESERSYYDQTNGDGLSFSGKYYFDDVDSSVGPLAEAGFLSQAPWISLETDSFIGDSDLSYFRDSQENRIGGSWYFENGLFVTLGFGKQQATTDRPQGASVKQQLAKIGYYITDSTALTLSKSTDKYTYIVLPSNEPSDDFFKIDEIAIRAKHLLPFGGKHLALSAGWTYNNYSQVGFEGIDGNAIEVGAAYYPMKNLGLSFSLKDEINGDFSLIFGDTDLINTIGAEYFINSNISVGVKIKQGIDSLRERDFSDEKAKSQTFSLTSRF